MGNISVDSRVTSPSPLGKQVWYEVSSDDADIVRMKGYIDLDPDAIIILDPEIGDTNTFIFDFQKIVESNLGGYLTTEEGGHGMPIIDTFTILDANEAFYSINPTFTELVSTASGGLVEGSTISPVGVSTNVLNSFLPREQSQTFGIFDLNSSSDRFLTNNSPNSPFPITSRKIRLEDNEWLSAFDSTAHTDLYLRVAVTNTSGVETVSYIDASDLATYDRADIPVGPVNLNAATLDTTYGSGVQPIIDSTTKSYTVRIVSLGSEEITNGTFAVDANWTKGGNWTIGSGVATNSVFGTGDVLSQTLTLSTNQDYIYTGDGLFITNTTKALVQFNDVNIVDMIGTGLSPESLSFSQEFTTDSVISNADIEIIATVTSGFVSVDNISIKTISTLSETVTYIISDRCLNHEVRFHWENRLGGLDSYTFQSENRGIRVNKKSYNKPLTKDFTVESRGKTTLGGTSNIQYQAFTLPLKDNELIWLEELFEDRATYIEVNSEFIPVTVTRNSVQTVEDGLVQLRIDYTYANERIILGK